MMKTSCVARWAVVLVWATLSGGGVLAGAGALAQAAEAAPEASTAETAGAIESTDEAVAVEPTADDGAIGRRLTDILEATGRYDGLRVRVDDGVVFLEGATREDRHRTLAGDLARRVSDVVAVVNNVEVVEGPVWDAGPAWAEARRLVRDVIRALPLVLLGLAVLGVTVLLAGPLAALLARPLDRLTDSRLVQGVLRKLVYLLLLLAGAYLFLRVSGLTRVALTLVSGTGLVGLVLGFAFRDIAENFLASLLISVQKPFQLGDVIEVDGNKGVVERVTTRGTTLVDFDGNHIQMTNSTVYKNTIRNFTANPKVRIRFVVGVGYDASVVTAQQTVRQVLAGQQAVLDDPAPQVLVDALGSSTINLVIYFWVDGNRHNGTKVKSAVLRRSVRALEAAGVSMPDDAREVIFPAGVPVRQLEHGGSPGGASGVGAGEAAWAANRERDAHDDPEDLSSDVEEIKQQAAAARRPDEGESVL